MQETGIWAQYQEWSDGLLIVGLPDNPPDSEGKFDYLVSVLLANTNGAEVRESSLGSPQKAYDVILTANCFEVNDGELFAFAGIWDRWTDQNRNTVETCSILTTSSNAVTSAVHDRMPVILDPDSYDIWLDPGMRDVTTASELLKPYDAQFMRSYPISTRINHVANDDEECSAPVEPSQAQARLFV